MQEIWRRIEEWIAAKAPEVFEVIQVGATDAQIKELEEFLAIKPPEDLKSLYRVCDGQLDYRYGVIEGRELLSLDRIKEEWIVWNPDSAGRKRKSCIFKEWEILKCQISEYRILTTVGSLPESAMRWV